MATFYVHNIVSPKCSWGNFEQFKVHVSSRQKKKMVKSADFDGNMSIFWLKYILHMVLLHTRWLVSMGIFVLPFGPILNTVWIFCSLNYLFKLLNAVLGFFPFHCIFICPQWFKTAIHQLTKHKHVYNECIYWKQPHKKHILIILYHIPNIYSALFGNIG